MGATPILDQARQAGKAEARERYQLDYAQASQCWADEAERRYQDGIYEGLRRAPSRLRWFMLGALCELPCWLAIGWWLS